MRFEWPDKCVWAPPGGGLEPGESDEAALRRELAEECGLRDVDLGPCIWTREHWFADMAGWGGQVERHYLVRTPPFEPAPSAEALAEEGIAEVRWWTGDELRKTDELFAPRRLPQLASELLAGTVPEQPVDVGV